MPAANILLVGLGNPGKQYSATRHNVGFMAIDHWLNQQNLAIRWRHKPSPNSLLAKIKINDQTIRLLKPQTFMNESGKSVAEVLHFFKLKPNQLWVIHDDIDLPLGTIRLTYDASAAGHNGVQSIIDYLGTSVFRRCRLGIGRPPQNQSAADYVLQPFNQAEKSAVKLTITKTAELISLISRGALANQSTNLTIKI